MRQRVPGDRVVCMIVTGETEIGATGKLEMTPLSSFGNDDLGAAVEVDFNRYIGVEDEASGALGVSQDLQLGGQTSNLKSPHLLNDSGKW